MAFVLARLDVDDVPKQHRAGMQLTTNCGYLLVMGPESSETKPALAGALLHVLHNLDPDGHRILDTLRHNLGRDEPRTAGALESVKGLGPRAASLVPEIEKALLGGRRTYLQVNAAKALMEIGKDAAPALPSLRKLAGDARPKVQNQWGDVSTAAAQAVKVIEAAVARTNR